MTVSRNTFAAGLATRDINSAIVSIMEDKLADWEDTFPNWAATKVERKLEVRTKKMPDGTIHRERRYMFSLVSDLRATLIAEYTASEGVIDLTFPANYKGWHRTSQYDRLRIAIRDEILYKSKLVDRSLPSWHLVAGSGWVKN